MIYGSVLAYTQLFIDKEKHFDLDLEQILLAKYKVNRSTYLTNYMHGKAKVNGMFSHMTSK